VGVAPTMTSRTFTGATTPARSARADLLLRAHARPACGAVPSSVGPAPPPARRSMLGIPNVRLDHRVAGDLRCRDSVAAVVDVEDVTGPDQPYRRRLTSLLEPCSVELDLREVEVTSAEADVCERDPCRCERRMCDTPPFSRSSRVRTGGVEPPQPLATRLQRAELADARRPRDRAAGRARTDTAGITTPDACRYITAAKRNGRRDWPLFRHFLDPPVDGSIL
jgi:hypothetical protein